VIVNLSDGVCRTCGGQLEIIDFDDASMAVVCCECADCYDVEPDAFGDGCMSYYFPLLASRVLADEPE
jgi:hypothetical protein